MLIEVNYGYVRSQEIVIHFCGRPVDVGQSPGQLNSYWVIMRASIMHFIIIVVLLFAAINYYIGLRGWQAFHRWLPGWGYWTVFILLAGAYLAGRFLERAFPQSPASILTIIGSYWLGFMYYALLLVVLIDIVRLLYRWWHFIPANVLHSPQWVGVAGVSLLLLIMSYGIWNALHPIVRHYDLTIDKDGGDYRTFHAVLVTDIHLGRIVNARRLAGLVERVNALHPDVVLLGGDTIDEDVGPFAEQQMPAIFQRLNAPLGCYAIFGNHEYLGGQAEEAARCIRDAHIIVLRDQTTLVANSFYLVGRDDLSSRRTTHRRRAALSDLLQGIERNRPIIMLDHQPFHLEEAEEAGVDLQLSGHTHRGQLYPNNYITHAVFEDDWGYLRKGACQFIVSCGYGTWGPPLRTGNTPEIVDMTIHFRKKS